MSLAAGLGSFGRFVAASVAVRSSVGDLTFDLGHLTPACFNNSGSKQTEFTE